MSIEVLTSVSDIAVACQHIAAMVTCMRWSIQPEKNSSTVGERLPKLHPYQRIYQQLISAKERKATLFGGIRPLIGYLYPSEQPHSHIRMGSTGWSQRGNLKTKGIKWEKYRRLPGKLVGSTRKNWKKVVRDVSDQYTLHKYRELSKNKNIIKLKIL